MRGVYWALLASAVSLSACDNLNSVYRTGQFQTGDASYAIVDAEQRAIVSGERAIAGSPFAASRPAGPGGTPAGGELPHELRNGTASVVCAEPSPDVFTVVGLSIAGEATFDEDTNAALRAALSQTGQNIGLRTQTITLLRDMMYRACEAYLGGALDDFRVEVLHQRVQNIALALLAVEQLTGAVQPNFAQIASSAGLAPDEWLVSIADRLAVNAGNLAALEDAKATAEEAKSDACGATEDVSEEAAAESAACQSATAELQSIKQQITREAARKMHLETAQQALAQSLQNISTFGSSGIISPQVAEVGKEVSEDVKEIVGMVVNQDMTDLVCTHYLTRDPRERLEIAENARLSGQEDGTFYMCLYQLYAEINENVGGGGQSSTRTGLRSFEDLIKDLENEGVDLFQSQPSN